MTIKKDTADSAPNNVTSEELVTPAMPTPTALPTDEVKPLINETPDNNSSTTTAPVIETVPEATTTTAAPSKAEPTEQQAEILLLRDQMRALTEAVDKVKNSQSTQAEPTPRNVPNIDPDQFANKAAVDKLNQQLADLTTKLDTINQRTETLMQTVQNSQNNAIEAKTPIITEVAEKPIEKAEIKTPPKIVAKPKPKPAYKPAPRVVAKKPVAPIVHKATWQLRSASPGVAGLAKNGGSEIQTFVVGDTVPNVGRVTAVQQDASGQWVVLTTGGTLHQ